MDYWINDGIVHPETAHEKTAEEIYRLPRCWVCYQPRGDVPGVAPPPSAEAGASRVTFGSFNNLNKVSPRTIAMWAAVLRAVPDSQMLIKSRPLDNRLVQDRLRAAFAGHGIEAERLLLYGSIAGSGNHMALYNRIDVGLDSFPFTGGATSLDAFWMGVPVITLVGETHAERMSASLITALGRPEWIADTEEAFIAKAAALAADQDLRVSLRAGQRQRMAESTLCDSAGLARAMEDAYRDMWRRYLDGDGLIAATP
jgi:predicted O-linked N-acetylglucosamine transferase (SPINDLY family)